MFCVYTMYPPPIQKLINAFTRFPGIGPRQAARFAFHLLADNRESTAELSRAINELHAKVAFCTTCYKSVERTEAVTGNCELCKSDARDPAAVMIVEKEADLANIEKTGAYKGRYHVLGGTIDPLDSSAPTRLRIKELFERIKLLKAAGKSVEVILATNATTAGDATALYLDRTLRPLGVVITRLGRGLTTGTELEYSDGVTIANALTNRK